MMYSSIEHLHLISVGFWEYWVHWEPQNSQLVSFVQVNCHCIELVCGLFGYIQVFFYSS